MRLTQEQNGNGSEWQVCARKRGLRPVWLMLRPEAGSSAGSHGWGLVPRDLRRL